jgi:DNA-binding MarR family transcriptional regulator
MKLEMRELGEAPGLERWSGAAREASARESRLGVLPTLLGHHLRRTQMAVFQSVSRALAEFDVTPGRFGVLAVIASNPGLSQSELGAILGIDRSTVVAVIDRLESAGLVRRRPAPNDRRSYALALSDRGAAAYDELELRIAEQEQRMTRHLSPAERALLIDLLGRIARDSA